MREPSPYSIYLNFGPALGYEQPVRFWYLYTPARPGHYSGPPERCYPDEPAEVEFIRFELLWRDKVYELPLEMLDEEYIAQCRQSIIRKEEAALREALGEAAIRSHSYD